MENQLAQRKPEIVKGSRPSKPELQQQLAGYLETRMEWARSMYPHLQLTAETVENYVIEWFEIALQVGSEQFDIALRHAVQASRFFPTVAEIREHAGLLPGKTGAASAEAAWVTVQEYVRRYYGAPGRWPKLPERIDRAVRSIGGIAAIGDATTSNIAFIRRDFMESFKNMPAVMECETRAGWKLLLEGPTVPEPSIAEQIAERRRIATEDRQRNLTDLEGPGLLRVKVFQGASLTDEQLAEKKCEALKLEKQFSQDGAR
jgi:hypothetical protein